VCVRVRVCLYVCVCVRVSVCVSVCVCKMKNLFGHIYIYVCLGAVGWVTVRASGL